MIHCKLYYYFLFNVKILICFCVNFSGFNSHMNSMMSNFMQDPFNMQPNRSNNNNNNNNNMRSNQLSMRNSFDPFGSFDMHHNSLMAHHQQQMNNPFALMNQMMGGGGSNAFNMMVNYTHSQIHIWLNIKIDDL